MVNEYLATVGFEAGMNCHVYSTWPMPAMTMAINRLPPLEIWLILHFGTRMCYSWPLFLLLSVNVGFSKQNIVKTCFRNSLSVSTLNNLMRISIDGPGLVTFDFGAAFQKWKSMKARRILK